VTAQYPPNAAFVRRTIEKTSYCLVVIGLYVLGCTISACASSGSSSATDCLPTQTDSVYLSGGPVYRDCAVDRKARLLESSVHVNYQPTIRQPAGSVQCYYAEIHLVADASGRPELETARLGRTNEPNWGQAVLASVQNWRFEPALKNGEPVRQIVLERRVTALAVTVVRAGEARRPPPQPDCR
jgi:hypothetical protein